MVVGTSLLDPAVRHVLSEVDEGVAGKLWQFTRRIRGAPDSVILPQLGTLPGGASTGKPIPTRRAGQVTTAIWCSSTRTASPPPDSAPCRWSMAGSNTCGSFTGDANITHVLTEIDPDPTVKLWRLWRHQKDRPDEVIDDKVRLLPDGRLDGHLHPNEAGWRLDGTDIVLISATGTPTTRLAPVAASNGALNYEGQFSLNPAITHRLEERAIGWPLGHGYVTWLEPADRPGVHQRPKDPRDRRPPQRQCARQTSSIVRLRRFSERHRGG